MKKNQLFTLAILCLVLPAFLVSGCFKDTGFYRYTVYSPVYKTTADVRAGIKSDVPRAVEQPGKLYIIGNYILLNEKYRGVHIIDNTNPSSPVNKAFINIPGNEDIAVSGNTLYADCYTDMMTIDISDPMQASLKKYTSNMFPDRRFINGFSVDSIRVITEWIARDTTIKTSVPVDHFFDGNKLYSMQFFSASALYSSSSTANSIGTAGQGGSMARFAIQNGFLYTVTQSALNTVNITQPQQPSWTSTINLGWGIETIYPFKDKLFIGSNTGMQIFSVANPASPQKLGTFAHARVCDPVIADDNYAYVTLRSGTTCQGFTNQLDVVNVQNPTSSTLVKSYQLTNPKGLSKSGNMLFICDGSDGFKCFDATDVNNVTLKKQVTMSSEAFDVICTNNRAVVSAKDGLYQYEISDVNNIRLLSKIGLKN